MKKLFLLLFAINFISHGQKSIGIELCLEYQNSIKSFSSNSLAENALDEILNVIGVAKNFYLIPCDDISNALAITFKGERYIIYDKDFINDINNSTSDWSGKFILAHEVGHHINGHTRDFLIASVLDDQTKEKQKEEELEADEFAGFIIAKLGASFYQIKELMDIIASENDDEYSTHPSRSKRIEAMKRGFNKARVSLDNSSKEGNITKIESNTNQSPLSEVLSIDFNNEINWLTMNEALAKQKKQPKKIMIDMYTVWCGPCKMLDRNTFSNKKLIEYVNANYYAVKFNAEGDESVDFKGQPLSNPKYDSAKARRRNSQHQLTGYFGVSAYPTIVFLGENAEFLAPIPGYKTPDQLELYLKLFAEDHYKTITSQKAFNEYYKAFKPSFTP